MFYRMASSPIDILIDETRQHLCRRPSGKFQRRMCRKSPHLLADAIKGAEISMHECAKLFSGEKWNCASRTPQQQRNIVEILKMGEYWHLREKSKLS